MIEPYKLAQEILTSNDFKKVLFANYIEHSEGRTMKEYVIEEKNLLCLGSYGVEDFHLKVNEYIKFLEWFLK